MHYSEPSLCGVPVTRLAGLFVLFSGVQSFLYLFYFTITGATVVMIVECIYFVCNLGAGVCFSKAIQFRSPCWAIPLLLMAWFNLIGNLTLVVVCIVSATGSPTFLSQQIQETYNMCGAFQEFVDAVYGGDVHEVVVGYSIFMGVLSLLMALLYIIAYRVHFMLYCSFRKHRSLERSEAADVQLQQAEWAAAGLSPDGITPLPGHEDDLFKPPTYEQILATPTLFGRLHDLEVEASPPPYEDPATERDEQAESAPDATQTQAGAPESS